MGGVVRADRAGVSKSGARASVANSGYWLLQMVFTSSGVILGSESGSFTPLYVKLRDSTFASIMVLGFSLLLR